MKPTLPQDDDGSSFTFTLPDGRQLGYAEFGSRTGKPIILLHGLACSRLDGAYFHDIACQLDVRIIGVDRPGMGESSPHPNRTLLGFARDVDDLTNHLQLSAYCVMVRIIPL